MEGIDFDVAWKVVLSAAGAIYLGIQIWSGIKSNSVNKTDSDQNENINKHDLRIKSLEDAKAISDAVVAKVPLLERNYEELDRRATHSENRIDGFRKFVDDQLEKELGKIEKKIDDQTAKNESNFNYMVDLILRVLGEDKKAK